MFARSLVASFVLATAPAVFAAGAAPHATYNVSTLRASSGYDRFIVTYRDGTTQRSDHAAATQAVSAALSRAAGTTASLRAGKAAAAPVASYARKLGTGADLVRVSRKLSATEAQALIRQIATDPSVAHVQADVMMQKVRDIPAAAAVSPVVVNDQYYARYQWHFRAPDGTAEKIGSDANSYANKGGSNVANAWNLSDGTGVTVAVLDTGITNHPDIDLSLADAGYDFISDAYVSGRATDGRVSGGWDLGDWTTDDKYLATNGGCVDANNPAEDSSWHGTHVSGNIAELTNNTTGMAGIAYKAKVLPVRVLGHCGGYSSDIADGIVWASGGHVDGVPDNTHPAQVINMSLGGEGKCSDDDVTADAITAAISRGTTVVVAAGNEDDDTANYSPSSCPGVIAVASNGITGKRAFYSNYGTGVTISAPGGGVYPNDASSGTPVSAGFSWSAINDGTHEPTTADYGGMAGTSQATPHVAGTVALMLAATKGASLPTPTPAQIKALLTSTAHSFSSTEASKPIGAGIVDAYAAVNKALGNDTGPGEPDVTALTNGTSVKASGDGSAKVYSIDVPAGARTLVFTTSGGSGDVSIAVKNGSAGTETVSAKKATNNETVTVARPAAGTWYLTVTSPASYANVNVLVRFTAP
ncbi:S8 family serine peptidase [Luteibacter aegosomaticola]|uniref:S8 family peptidase n=1 Tax=Luteibacter aegosomaticola TaxID=2911538 RepID=UPI001FFC0FAF|nr:S8 family peptidase [Luteibacter aegosomaticola]UPG90639.1 S8 family serine peptidase [Luteibacter aegosomaticola]